eukprot:1303620-Amphidinium_carterae.1
MQENLKKTVVIWCERQTHNSGMLMKVWRAGSRAEWAAWRCLVQGHAPAGHDAGASAQQTCPLLT